MKKDSFAVFIGSWCDYDPAAAAAYVSTLPEGDARQNEIETVAQSWGYNDPAGAAQWVAGLPDGPEEKAPADAALAERWVEDDPRRATAWVSQMPPGVMRDAAAKGVSNGLVFSAPMKAEKWAESIGDLKLRETQIRAVIEQCIARDRFGSRDSVALINGSSLPSAEKAKLLEQVPKIKIVY
jgi:hypothetical protein